MHDHSINECFRLHPNLRKDKGIQKGNENVVSKEIQVPVGPLEDNAGHVNLELGNVIHGNEGEEDATHIISSSIVSKPALNSSGPSNNDNVSEGFEVQIPSIPVLEGAKNILEQERWVNTEIVNSSDDLVVVLDVRDVVSSKPVGNVVSSKPLEIIHNDVIETDVGFSTVNHNEFPPINVLPVNAFSDQRQQNSSTVEDGVLFLEGDNSSLDPSGGEMNNEIISDHYLCDAYTDTKIEINAKCYAREDNDLSFSKGRGKRGRKPRNIIL
ncbi:hypothetical protein MA16_Dca014471 [Dendrobium catenatum]|uniref:Uncharacterized protein n=1 Tax=Dendrobium catenatum TaxID=906689 RepID=A0A2I0W2Z4_9ASPA|nr:hypothetical protein MA16_Dca014471 [Dendrobium catenatum]